MPLKSRPLQYLPINQTKQKTPPIHPSSIFRPASLPTRHVTAKRASPIGRPDRHGLGAVSATSISDPLRNSSGGKTKIHGERKRRKNASAVVDYVFPSLSNIPRAPNLFSLAFSVALEVVLSILSTARNDLHVRL